MKISPKLKGKFGFNVKSADIKEFCFNRIRKTKGITSVKKLLSQLKRSEWME
jgi:hypothetical protein